MPRWAIDCIQHKIKMSLQNFRSVRFEKERMDRMNVAAGIYRSYAPGHDIDFRFSEFRLQCMELAIGIADANVIKIDERQFADA